MALRCLAFGIISFSIATLTVAGSAQRGTPQHVIDLTQRLSPAFPIVPVPGLTFPFEQKTIATLQRNDVFAEEWHLIPHSGTHMDAPIHYVEGGRAMDGLNVRELIVAAAVIDIHERASKDRDTALRVEDIRRWESRHGRLPERVAVLMYSGWDSKAVGDPTDFVGIDSAGATHFPTFSREAVAFLIRER